MSRAVDRSRKIYARLLRLYPRDFRREFAEELSDCFARLAGEARQRSRWWGVLRVWIFIVCDLLLSVPREHWLSRENLGGHFMNDQLRLPRFTLYASATVLLLAGLGLLAVGFNNLVVNRTSILYPPQVNVWWDAAVYDEDTEFVLSRAELPNEMWNSQRYCDALSAEQFKTIPLRNLSTRESWGRVHDHEGDWVRVEDLGLPTDVSVLSYRLKDNHQVQRDGRYCYQLEAAQTGNPPPQEIYFSGAPHGVYVQSIALTLASFASLLAGGLLLFLPLRLYALARRWPLLQPAT